MESANILISAMDKLGIVQREWAIVIDVGVMRLPNGKITGDIEFETAKDQAGLVK